jgi:NADPH:quinone reductase-like Zn-dependent oxidoreductase
MARASVLTEYGPPPVLQWKDVPMPEPSDGQIRIKVRVSGVVATDLNIRRGELEAIFPLPEPAVLGFETAGTVDALGSGVSGVAVGDEVAAWLPSLGGYGEYALSGAWTRKPSNVTWNDAGALPTSVEAAVGVLRQLGVAEGETLLILGAGGSVGMIAAQLAIRQGLKVIGAVGARDEPLTRELGAIPVLYGDNLLSNVREVADRVDATFDAAGKGGLEDAITLTGGSDRVITLADARWPELGVRFSAATPDRAPDAVDIGMQLLADGELRLRSQQSRCRPRPKRTDGWRRSTFTTNCSSPPATSSPRSRRDDDCSGASAPWLGLVRRGGKRSVLEDVLVDALEPDRERLEQLVRQAVEEQPSHEVDVPAGRAADRIPPFIGQGDLSRAPIGWSQAAFDQPTLLETPHVVREPAPLPADLRGQPGDAHPPARCVPQSVQDVVVGERKVAVRLQFAVHLVGEAQLHPHVGQPRALLVRRQRSERRLRSTLYFT